MTVARIVLFVALRQLSDRKVLNGIAVVGVALGVITLITLSALLHGFQAKFKEEVIKVSPHVTVSDRRLARDAPMLPTHVGTPTAVEVAGQRPSDRVGRVDRPYELVDLLESMPEVAAACVNIRGQAIASLGPQAQGVDMRGVRALDQDRCTPIADYVTAGSWHSLASMRDGVVLGSGVADRLGAKLGERVQIGTPGGSSESLVVAAIVDIGIPAIDNVRVYVNLSTAQSVLRRPNAVGHLEVRLTNPFESTAFARRLEDISGYECEGWQEANANFLSLFDLNNVVVNIVIAAILTLGGFGILSTQIMIVLQKTRDIAILRSIGFRRSDILGGVMLQGAIVALLGGALGDLLGWWVVRLLADVEVRTDGILKSNTLLVRSDPAFYVYGAAFALAVGISASLVPAFRASRVQPVTVLRGQV